jgi:hypothetical protein
MVLRLSFKNPIIFFNYSCIISETCLKSTVRDNKCRYISCIELVHSWHLKGKLIKKTSIMAKKKAEELDIFNVEVDDVEFHDYQKRDSILYAPKSKNTKDGVYEALIRFLPNPVNPKKSLIRKYTYYLRDSEDNGKNYDSPSTIHGQKCPIQQTYYKLSKSDSAVERKIAEKLNRREQFYVLAQIVDDKVNPNLNGKIKVFKFGKKLKAKIDAERNPTYGDKVQMFHLFEGKNFHLRLTRQGEFNNYDQCAFLKDIEPIKIDGVQMTKDKEHLAAIREYISVAPELENFEYRPWDDSTESEVMSILRSMKSPGRNFDQVTAKRSSSENIDKIVDEVDIDEKPKKESKESKETTKTNVKSNKDKNDDDDEDLDNFLENLEDELDN